MPIDTNMETAGTRTCDIRSVLAPFMTTYWWFFIRKLFVESRRLVAISVRNVQKMQI